MNARTKAIHERIERHARHDRQNQRVRLDAALELGKHLHAIVMRQPICLIVSGLHNKYLFDVLGLHGEHDQIRVDDGINARVRNIDLELILELRHALRVRVKYYHLQQAVKLVKL
jgi:hypothetical protein